MASGFGNWLRAQIDHRNMTDRHFAELAGLRPSALSYILTTPGAVPTIRTLSKIAIALEMDIDPLLLACGVTLHQDEDGSRAARISMMADAVPEVQRLLDDAVLLPPRHLRALQAYVDRVIEEIHEEMTRRGPRPALVAAARETAAAE